ncbi:MAG: hypothetical protein AB7E72_01510 [Lysobacterales bacterium]
MKALAIFIVGLYSAGVHAAQVTVSVHLETSMAITSGTVWIQNFEERPRYPGSAILADVAITDKDGRFTVNLAPGEYALNLVRDRCSWKPAKHAVTVKHREKRTSVEMIVTPDICECQSRGQFAIPNARSPRTDTTSKNHAKNSRLNIAVD